VAWNFFDEIGDRRLARTDSPEPQQARLLVLHLRPRFTRDVERLPMHVLGPAQREMQHAAANCRIGQLVDQDKPAKRAAVGIRLEHRDDRSSLRRHQWR
jgi:hypothetical protein